MANRRTPDSPQPSRPAPPAAVPLVAKPAMPPPGAAVKKTTKRARSASPQKQAVIGAKVTPAVSADERRGMIAKAGKSGRQAGKGASKVRRES